MGSPPDGAAGALPLLPCRRARSRRQQGTAWVRASIDREGRLLALRLEQSSGQPMLDDAALQTFRRAQPLPPIPDELKAPQELVVPVEYYLR
ncbi:energy transducer TonB [Stenotrophomonas maltophilia]|nr:energy transducer TonB [Stenotrophomonas maltophilia]